MSLKTISPFIKRQVRKLLLFVCGNKDKYRQIRDMHALSTSMKVYYKTNLHLLFSNIIYTSIYLYFIFCF